MGVCPIQALVSVLEVSLLTYLSFPEPQFYLGTKYSVSTEMISDLKLWGKRKLGVKGRAVAHRGKERRLSLALPSKERK